MQWMIFVFFACSAVTGGVELLLFFVLFVLEGAGSLTQDCLPQHYLQVLLRRMPAPTLAQAQRSVPEAEGSCSSGAGNSSSADSSCNGSSHHCRRGELTTTGACKAMRAEGIERKHSWIHPNMLLTLGWGLSLWFCSVV